MSVESHGNPTGGSSPPGIKNGNQLHPLLLLNWISLTGIFLAGIGLGAALLTLLLDLLSGRSQAYTGLLYLVYFAFIVMGVAAVPAGMLREVKNRKVKGKPSISGDLIIDFRKPAHRRTLLVVLGSGLFIFLLLTVGSYQTFQATETNDFCGNLCHSVMHPEYTTYNYSSHARVDCVECHIGHGADWYVRSKLSGIRQIFAVMTKSYPKPIPTPIVNLRPARETCEQCHWPKKFIGYKESVRSYYRSDEENSPYRIRMLMKIGGEEHSLMKGSGIHYHMLLASKVEYIARDQERQEIAWVRIAHDDGVVVEYEDSDNPLTEGERNSLPKRVMDCMDCHNRPSHQFPTPMSLVNRALDVGTISRKLPYIKVQAVRALTEEYDTTQAAVEGIGQALLSYYRKNYPKLTADRPAEVHGAIEEVRKIYQRSIFPEMNAKWSNYPDNIGHRDWLGCFRCHNDRLNSAEGKSIFTTCSRCHLILAQGENVEKATVDFDEGLAFLHPEGGDVIEEFTECVDCHTGGSELYD